MGAPGLAPGARIHEAVRRTRAAVGCNTNLGIVLLCAPLANAALARRAGDTLREALRRVLRALDVADAGQAYAAIRLAAPAGLGTSAEHDVRAPPAVTLLEAMRTARMRDRIAAQYANDYEDVFESGVPRLAQARARWRDPHWAATSAYLGFLAAFPDTHVARQHGVATAQRVQQAAAAVARTFEAAADPAAMRASLRPGMPS
jgi:triphosphoribosyl-dephospho-CoA synthase